MKRVTFSLVCIASSLVVLFATRNAGAAGYALQEQSGVALGQAFAGVSTGLGDGSSAFYNPGAMLALDSELTSSAAVHMVVPSARFSNTGSSFVPSLGGAALTGTDGTNGGEFAVVPNLYVVHKPLDRLAYGLAVNVPFGLTTEYADGWVGRYHAIKSELKTVNINPSVAFEVYEGFSLGAGVSAMYADAELTNAIDFGTIGFATLGPETASSIGLTPQGADGFGKVDGDDWGVGVNVGGLLRFNDGRTRFGVAWRSKIDIDVEGDAEFSVPSAALPLTATGAFTNTGAQASVDLPESLSFGLSHEIDDEWTFYGEALWTRWSRFDELRVSYDSVQPDTVTEEGWDDVWRFAGGLSYQPDEVWVFRGGLSIEKTPVSSPEFRTPRIPDADRVWLTAGVGYQFTDWVALHVSYAHIFASDEKINNVDSTGHVLVGEYDSQVDIATVQLVATL